jgi:hypothetical protein
VCSVDAGWRVSSSFVTAIRGPLGRRLSQSNAEPATRKKTVRRSKNIGQSLYLAADELGQPGSQDKIIDTAEKHQSNDEPSRAGLA